MKTTKLLLSFSLLAGVATLGFGQISGTAHDFSGAAWNTTDEICIVCHTPHNGQIVNNAPLWNHATTNSTFTLYTGGNTLDATLGQPEGQSLLCLSCHDGTVALDSYGGVTGTNFIGTVAPDRNVGTDLSNDHPISFTYDAALVTADGELHPITASTPIGGTIDSELLFGGEMQCASCHDVHGTSNAFLLRITNSSSALCLTCHDK